MSRMLTLVNRSARLMAPTTSVSRPRRRLLVSVPRSSRRAVSTEQPWPSAVLRSAHQRTDNPPLEQPRSQDLAPMYITSKSRSQLVPTSCPAPPLALRPALLPPRLAPSMYTRCWLSRPQLCSQEQARSPKSSACEGNRNLKRSVSIPKNAAM